MAIGISIVICCYNSAQRLPQTLAHLAVQQVSSDLSWEVIVVDNASTDGTAQVAEAIWSSEIAPLRVIYEPQQGISHARHRGFTEATYELVSFVDDDNWVCPNWVQTAVEIMSQHSDVAACGGSSEAVFEETPPSWFERYQGDYAVGIQSQQAGAIEQSRGFLWGAGLTVRKQAWNQLLKQGFQPLLTGRQAGALTSGEDYEFCLALRAAGWRLWYEPRLQFRHCLPASRLKWSYLRRLKRAIGACSVGLDPYFFLTQEGSLSLKQRLLRTWYCRIAIVLVKLLPYPHKLFLYSQHQWEGDSEIIKLEVLLGRLSELVKQRNTYGRNIKAVRTAAWRAPSKY